MAILEWKDSYSVGIKSLDHQHRRLLDLINELSVIDPKTADAKKVFTALNGLAEYAQTHFDTEEKLLVQYNYPKLVQQQREHVAFTGDVFQIAQDLEHMNSGVRGEVIDFLKNWFISHILGTDREYIDFLLSKGVT